MHLCCAEEDSSGVPPCRLHLQPVPFSFRSILFPTHRFCPLFSSLTKSLRLCWSLTSCLNWFSQEESRDWANSGGNPVSVRTGKLQTDVSPTVTWSPVETSPNTRPAPSTPVQVPGREVDRCEKCPTMSLPLPLLLEGTSCSHKTLHAGHLLHPGHLPPPLLLASQVYSSRFSLHHCLYRRGKPACKTR